MQLYVLVLNCSNRRNSPDTGHAQPTHGATIHFVTSHNQPAPPTQHPRGVLWTWRIRGLQPSLAVRASFPASPLSAPFSCGRFAPAFSLLCARSYQSYQVLSALKRKRSISRGLPAAALPAGPCFQRFLLESLSRLCSDTPQQLSRRGQKGGQNRTRLATERLQKGKTRPDLACITAQHPEITGQAIGTKLLLRRSP